MKADVPGLRVLIVEDEWLLAAELIDALTHAGFSTLGPVPRVREALALIDNDGPDVVVLDVSLGHGDSFPIARDLARRDIPFLFLTGYTKLDLPEEFRDRPLLSKPIMLPSLVDRIRSLVS